jgi:hypothetical protein
MKILRDFLSTDHVGPRWLRRALVVLLYGGVLTFAASQTIARALVAAKVADAPQYAAWTEVLLACGWAAIPAVVIAWLGLTRLGPLRAITVSGDNIDERILIRRNLSLSIAFWILAFVCLVESGIWSYSLVLRSEAAGTVLGNLDFAGPFIYGDAILAFTLPLAVLAWMEPNPPPDDTP